MGTGSSGGNATDGNDITSPRPFADDEDEIENYTYKSIYGGDGGHYKNEPAFANPNRTKMGMFELKKYIKKVLKESQFNTEVADKYEGILTFEKMFPMFSDYNDREAVDILKKTLLPINRYIQSNFKVHNIFGSPKESVQVEASGKSPEHGGRPIISSADELNPQMVEGLISRLKSQGMDLSNFEADNPIDALTIHFATISGGYVNPPRLQPLFKLKDGKVEEMQQHEESNLYPYPFVAPIKEQAYGSATLTTQGAPRTRAVAPAGKDPYTGRVEYPYTVGAKTKNGMMEEDESTSFKVIDVDTGKTIDFGLDKAKALEIAAFAIEDNINAEVLKMKDVNDVGNLKDEPIDPDYQGPSYDEVYLKNKLVGFKDAYEYDKGEIIIYPDLGSLQYKSRSTQEIVFKLEEGDLHFVRAFGMTRSYDELKKVLPELGQMGNSSYSGFMNVGVDDQPISLAKYGISGIEIAHDMIQALNIGREGEAAAQSKHYGAIRTPGTGGTGIEERINEQCGPELEDCVDDDEYHDKEKAKNSISKIKIQRDAAVAAASQGKGEATKAISQQETQLAETNKKIEQLKQEYTKENRLYKELGKRFEEMPIDTDKALEAKTEVYEQIVELRGKIQGVYEEIKDVRKQRNEMDKAVRDATSAAGSQPSVTKQFDQQIRDAKKVAAQIGKGGEGGGEIAETLLRQYEKDRVNVNLMEQMDIYNETTRGSLQKFFEMFEKGKTTSEVIRHYAKNGIQIPEQFCSKVKKQFESYKKLKLELGFSEQEAKDFKKALDLSQKEDTKKLSTKIFKK